MEINILNYIDDERMKEIAEQELRYALRNILQSKHNLEALLSNISYRNATRMVCDVFNLSKEEYEQSISERIAEILADVDSIRWKVFRRRDKLLGYEDSPAVKYLDEVLKDSKPKIEAAVNQHIDNYDFTELREEIGDTIYECIMRKLSEHV